MLLVTTADQTTWGRDEEILFLGEWCLVAGREEALEGRRYRVLPYHWDDRDKLYTDAQMLAERYKQILPGLAERLNAIHGTRHDVRYWRLAAGSWLIWMLAVVWDRHECLKRAAALGATHTYVLEGASLPPLDFTAMGSLAPRDDAWNHALCARLLTRFPAFSARALPARVSPASQTAHRNVRFRRLKALLRRVVRLIRPRIAFVNMHAPIRVQMRLQLALGQWPLILSAPAVPFFVRQQALRDNFTINCGNDEFGTAMSLVLAESFPSVLLEGYEAGRALALRSLPRSPRAIVTANAHVNEIFCLWAAEQHAPLIILQHGGHYGVDRLEMMEDHELAIADFFCSWGWGRDGHHNIRPMPAFKIQAMLAARAPASRRNLLVVYDSAHRYPYRIYNVPIAGQRRIDNEEQLKLLENLPAHLRAELRLRCHPMEDGFGFRSALRRMGFSRQFDTAGDMVASIKNARLCLIASNSTPLLEALASGTPTLAYYVPSFAEERDEAKPLFDALRKAGILHTDPAACAMKIAAVWDDPQSWWREPEVKAAHEAFVEHFASNRPDYLRHWRAFLTDVGR